MSDRVEYLECRCHGDEHTLKFLQDEEDKTIYTSVFLNQYHSFWKRLWIAIKYLFGYKCQYGHWDTWMLRYEDIPRLKTMLDEMDKNDPTSQSTIKE